MVVHYIGVNSSMVEVLNNVKSADEPIKADAMGDEQHIPAFVDAKHNTEVCTECLHVPTPHHDTTYNRRRNTTKPNRESDHHRWCETTAPYPVHWRLPMSTSTMSSTSMAASDDLTPLKRTCCKGRWPASQHLWKRHLTSSLA